ncbi:MAG: two-component system response regulator [Acidimicrobiia bacterium]
MPTVLIATDADSVFAQVDAVVGDDDTTVLRVRSGEVVRAAVAEYEPDLVVLDLQIGNMGGIAACLALRHEVGMDRLPVVPVLLLLDRPADVHLARRSAADGWIVKPLDPIRLRRAVDALLADGTYTEDAGFPTVEV